MLRTHAVFRSRVLASLAALSLGAMPVAAGAAEAPDGGNSLETRQFRIENAHLPMAQGSARQTVIAWQVTQGTWNGQSLDGLSIVLVQSTDASHASAQANCYISHEATPAQREALLAAFLATQPQLGAGPMRTEPAVITLEVEGQNVVLHLGLIA